MLYLFFRVLDKIIPAKVVHAHCDIPCGVYDPQASRYYARGIAKMVEKIQDLATPSHDAGKDEWEEYRNTMTRYIMVKEEQARKCKEELLILWTDYFKPEHLEMFSDLHDTFWQATKLCSKIKQTVDRGAVDDLMKKIDEIHDMFMRAEEAKK